MGNVVVKNSGWVVFYAWYWSVGYWFLDLYSGVGYWFLGFGISWNWWLCIEIIWYLLVMSLMGVLLGYGLAILDWKRLCDSWIGWPMINALLIGC
jgi:hypothetical protein